MSQADPGKPYATVKICPECRADCPLHARRCWLCGALLENAQTIMIAGIAAAEPVEPRRPGISEPLFAVLTLLALGLTLLVILGLGLDQKGMAIAVAVVLAPPLAAIAVQSLIRQGRGQPFSWRNAFVILAGYLMSVSVALLLVVVLVVATLIAAVAACFQACTQPGVTTTNGPRAARHPLMLADATVVDVAVGRNVARYRSGTEDYAERLQGSEVPA